MSPDELNKIQNLLKDQKLDGWLFYDFRRSNPIACRVLKVPSSQLMTRRFFYWIPTEGTPVKIVNKIEEQVLDFLPGEKRTYSTWQDLESVLDNVLIWKKRIAMEYSPRAAIPEISRVDAGTIDLIREKGVEVVSSGDLVQLITSFSNEQLKSHFAAAEILSAIVEDTWIMIADSLTGRIPPVTEYQVQQFILKQMGKSNCISKDLPICAVNENSANPHFEPSAKNTRTIKASDFILLDLWCKLDKPHSIYADISRVGVAAAAPSPKQQQIFDIVKKARDAATQLVITRFLNKEPVHGFEVDSTARGVIFEAGFGDYFIHRTGHNIDENDHGQGAHIDSYETNDTRLLVPGSCFSIEPGIYLPGEFGVRLEYNMCINPDETVQVTGGVQNHIETLIGF